MANYDSTSFQLPLPLAGQTVEIPLTRGQVSIIDAIDTDLASFKWYALHLPNYADGRGYMAVRWIRLENGKRSMQLMHRLIMERISQHVLIKQEQVDHIDRNPLNNCRSNLRLATNQENNRNKSVRSDSTSGYKGTWFDNRIKRWRSAITMNGRKKHLGCFQTPEEAHQAYCEAAIKYFGEFVRLD